MNDPPPAYSASGPPAPTVQSAPSAVQQPQMQVQQQQPVVMPVDNGLAAPPPGVVHATSLPGEPARDAGGGVMYPPATNSGFVSGQGSYPDRHQFDPRRWSDMLIAKGPEGEWRDGIFSGWCNNCYPAWCFACFLCTQCVLLGQVSESIQVARCQTIFGIGVVVFVLEVIISTAAGGYYVSLLAIYTFVVAMWLRRKFRNLFSIDGNYGLDCLAAFFCPWCTISQMARHLFNYQSWIEGPGSGDDCGNAGIPTSTMRVLVDERRRMEQQQQPVMVAAQQTLPVGVAPQPAPVQNHTYYTAP